MPGLVVALGVANAVSAQIGTQRVASGLSAPIFVTAPPNDPRLFIVERGGVIKVQSAPGATPTTFLDISAIVRTDGERGLLGMAFDPNFASNGRFYVDFIRNTGTFDTNVLRYTAPNPASSAQVTATPDTIITVAQPVTTNHKAGWIGFRPGDANNLYVATGDGGGANDTSNHAQDLTSNLGKILRLNVSGTGNGYTTAGNPFTGATPGNDEIWAYGVRNPFRDSFDRQTGNFYIGDVGQDTREEVDVEEGPGTGGRNYGWHDREGTGDNPGVAGTNIPAGAVDPVFDYVHGASVFSPTSSASITGGYVYRGSRIPFLQGTYFFADYISGKIGSFVYDPNTNALVPGSLTDRTSQLDPTGTNFGTSRIASFGEDGLGEMYIVDIVDGEVFKIVPEPGAVMVTLSLLSLWALRRRSR